MKLITLTASQSSLLKFLAVPIYFSGTITCPMPPNDPPGDAKMVVSPDQPNLMCPGVKAIYDCAAGGIDVRHVCISEICIFKHTLLQIEYRY